MKPDEVYIFLKTRPKEDLKFIIEGLYIAASLCGYCNGTGERWYSDGEGGDVQSSCDDCDDIHALIWKLEQLK